MATQPSRSAEKSWWRLAFLASQPPPRRKDPEEPVKGEYNGLCQRFACDNSAACWYNQNNGRYYCSACARTFNEVLRQQGRIAMCELHLSR